MEPVAAPALDVEAIAAQFPILREKPHGKPLIYFDNSASTVPLKTLSYVVAPVFNGADGKPFEGPAVRAR